MEHIRKFLRIRPKKKERTFFYNKKEVAYTYKDVKLVRQAQSNKCLMKINLCSKGSFKYSSVRAKPTADLKAGKRKGADTKRISANRTKIRAGKRYKRLDLNEIVDVIWRDARLEEHTVKVNAIPDDSVFEEKDLDEIVKQRDEKYLLANKRIKLPDVHEKEVLDLNLALVYKIEHDQTDDATAWTASSFLPTVRDLIVYNTNHLLVYDIYSFKPIYKFHSCAKILKIYKNVLFHEEDAVIKWLHMASGESGRLVGGVENFDVLPRDGESTCKTAGERGAEDNMETCKEQNVCSDADSSIEALCDSLGCRMVYTEDNSLFVDNIMIRRFRQRICTLRMVKDYVLITSTNMFHLYKWDKVVVKYNKGTMFSALACRTYENGLLAVLNDINGDIFLLLYVDRELTEKRFHCGDIVEFLEMHNTLNYFCVGLKDETIVYKYENVRKSGAIQRTSNDIRVKVVKRIPGRYRKAYFDDELPWLYLLSDDNIVYLYN
ncbi:hypothetical protein VCUG_00150 [Vavraia culicis subsp. floridensis]|uniref:Uncharacterized protein n=1 Tax=Vavraia culicis (isolate floridensis) TaxID=948595 RepID=L2GXF0_VAVCU|nr:uncharacterized protein VCUG_00150 [Vavraia culicis subsp. floridensis]ELA48314.1 hypothetical protein VCUG_00150 [Vavraia culicis subsp. floridensis]